MSDRELDRLVRSAVRRDPGRGVAALGPAGDDLLEEIMRTQPHPTGVPGTPPASDDRNGTDGTDDPWTADVRTLPGTTRRPASRLRRAAAVAAVAAAVAGAAFGASRLPFGGDGTVVQTPAAVPTPVPSAPDGRHPWIALTGWTLLSAFEQAPSRSLEFGTGDGARLSVEMYGETEHGQRLAEVTGATAPAVVEVPGGTGTLAGIGGGEFQLVMEPRLDVVTVLRGPATDRAAFEALLANLRWVDDATWESLVPADMVTPGRELDTARRMLADMDVPAGLTADDLTPAATNDDYQFGAYVAGAVVCRWIERDLAARASGDTAVQERAEAALEASREWDVLQQMDPKGYYPETVWEYADALTKGTAISGGKEGLTVEGTYRDALGCDR